MSKFEIKDLINIGVFAALYFIVFYAVGMTQVVPILYAISPITLALIAGIPMMLFVTRVDKFGMISIMGIIVSLVMFLMGHSYLILITGIVFSVLGDYIMSLGNYKDFTKIALGNGVFSLWCFGAFLPMWLFKDQYIQELAMGMGQEYADAVLALSPDWSIILYLLGIVVGGIIGAYIGRIILKKHFERAGIA